jgi:hypothetical protein
MSRAPSSDEPLETSGSRWWILAVVATVGELCICRVSLCVRIILIGELYLVG